MAADINEIISKEAIEGLRKANQYFIDIDGNIRKSIDELKAFNTSFRGVAATQESIVSGQTKMQNQSAKLTQIQKDEAKAIKEVEEASKALERQRQAGLAVMAKEEAKLREYNSAEQVAIRQKKQLSDDIKRLSKEGEKWSREIEKEIAASQKLSKAEKDIIASSAALNKQRQAALSQIAKQEAKEKELAAALRMEVKTLQDAQKQNSALTQARKTIDLTTKQGQEQLRQYNATLDKNTAFIRANSDAAGKQRMNIGNYSSALDGLGAKLAGAFSVGAILAFGRASFSAFEDQEIANRKLLFSLKGNKTAFEELTNQANEFQSKTGIADDAIQGIQVLAAESGKGTEQIKKITEATINWSKLTGQDLQSAYLQINATLNGTAGRLTRVDSAFGTLTETQLKSGAAIDLILTKYKGFAENAASETEKLSANWDEFKESAGGAIGGIVNPLLRETSSLLSDINTKQGFWQKSLTLLGSIIPGGTTIGSSFDAVNSTKKAKGFDSKAVKDDPATQLLIEQAKAAGKAKAQTLDYSEAFAKAAENTKKFTKDIAKPITEYEKLTNRISDLTSQMTELRLANKPVPDSMVHELISSQAKLESVKKEVEGITVGLVKMTAKGAANIPLTGTGLQLTKRDNTATTGTTAKTSIFGEGEGKQFAIDQAQVVADATFQIMANASDAELEMKLSNLDKEKEARLSNAKLTDAQRAKIEAEYEKKSAKMKTDAAKKSKAAAIIQSIINTALAVVAQLSVPGAGPALAIAAGIAGAAQTAIIAAQKIPQFDSGTQSTPGTFIAGERRPEFMVTPSGQVQLVTRPTLFKNMAGATVIGGEETAEIMRATNSGTKQESLAPYIREMKSEIVNAITNKRELYISGSGSRITERHGEYYKTYFNRKISWAGKRN